MECLENDVDVEPTSRDIRQIESSYQTVFRIKTYNTMDAQYLWYGSPPHPQGLVAFGGTPT